MQREEPVAPGRIARVTLALGVLAVVGQAGCDNDCDFFERCNGNVREECGDGPDQTFHRRIHQFPCEAPNTACVERDEDHAECVLPGKTKCGAGFERHCDDDILVVCSNDIGYSDPSNEPPKYESGVDCSADDRTCIAYGDDASCAESKP